MKYWVPVLVLVTSCVGTEPPSGGTVASQIVQQPSLVAAASQARSAGGFVVVVHRVSVSETRRGQLVAAGRDGAFLTHDEASYVLEVVDPLGEAWSESEALTVVARVGPEYVVDEAGEPLEGWTVSNGAPASWQLPPAEGDFVVFTFGLSRESQRALLVAPVVAGEASGEHTEDGRSVPLAELRRAAGSK